jgi:hypothetical protein
LRGLLDWLIIVVVRVHQLTGFRHRLWLLLDRSLLGFGDWLIITVIFGLGLLGRLSRLFCKNIFVIIVI